MSHENGLSKKAEGTPIRGAPHPGSEPIEITVKDGWL